METCCRKGNRPELRISRPTPWFMAKAVPARRNACFPQKGSNKKALGHAGAVSCVGGWIVYCFWTFEKILSYLDLFEGIAFLKKLNKIR
jgi:hypothetical protein